MNIKKWHLQLAKSELHLCSFFYNDDTFAYCLQSSNKHKCAQYNGLIHRKFNGRLAENNEMKILQIFQSAQLFLLSYQIPGKSNFTIMDIFIEFIGNEIT